MNNSAAAFLTGSAGPRFEAALRLNGFPPDAMLVICFVKQGELPPAHVDACCCVCGTDVVRSLLSLQLNSLQKLVAVGCTPCVQKALNDARRMGAA